jgi:hypothetical protein
MIKTRLDCKDQIFLLNLSTYGNVRITDSDCVTVWVTMLIVWSKYEAGITILPSSFVHSIIKLSITLPINGLPISF